MRTADFDYFLPTELIAQLPVAQRDQSRLFVLRRVAGQFEHRQFVDLLNLLRAGDVLVLNNSRVIPARLHGVNARTAGQFEILLLEENATNDWWTLMRPGKRARIGTRVIFRDTKGRLTGVEAVVVATNAEGHRRLCFNGVRDLAPALDGLGEVPLPPYISRDDDTEMETDRQRYQTVFAGPAGSVAAPTAGLHFTQTLLKKIRGLGVDTAFITLHVGIATFAPVKTETLALHEMHEERYEVSEDAARLINQAKSTGRRVIAAGTTTLRVLESVAARDNGRLVPGAGRTRLFVYPPYEFKVVDALLTNFHLPRSTLLMLVSAFAAPGEMRGRELMLRAYREAIGEHYRFYSYGDAMLLL